MAGIVLDGIGALFLVFGAAILVATLRAATKGRRAYHANKRVTPRNPLSVGAGVLNVNSDDRERRTKSGMAVRLKTGELVRQEKLSTEAIDEVICR